MARKPGGQIDLFAFARRHRDQHVLGGGLELQQRWQRWGGFARGELGYDVGARRAEYSALMGLRGSW